MVVLGAAPGGSGFLALEEDLVHDTLKLLVNLLSVPSHTDAVLGHLKTAGSDTTGVGGLSRCEESTGSLVGGDSIISGRHVSTLRDEFAAKFENMLSLLTGNLVLSGAWHDNVNFAIIDVPWGLAVEVLGSLGELGVLAATATGNVLDAHDLVELGLGEAIRLDDGTVGVREAVNLSTKLEELLTGILSNVTGTRKENRLSFKVLAFLLHHFFKKVDCSITSSLGSDQGATPVKTFTS